MGNIIDNMRKRIQQIADPNDPYCQADFDREFANSHKEYDVSSETLFKINLNFTNQSNNSDPEYATAGASGFDLRANVPDSMVIPAGKHGLVPTGLFFEVPQNFEIQIRPRSGLAPKNGVTVLNSLGTIDSDYRGEIVIILINFSDKDFHINNGDRVAQAVVAPVSGKNMINLKSVSEIKADTHRGTGKFGSTGIN